MKKIFLFILLHLSTMGIIFGDETVPNRLSIGASLGISAGFFDSDLPGIGPSVLATLVSLRGGINLSVLYNLNDQMSVGPELGMRYLSFTNTSTNKDYLFIEIPTRVAFKYGNGNTFIQPFLGYYFTTLFFPFPGFEVGAKAALGGAFIEGSYVLGTPIWKQLSIGIVFSDLFKI